METPKPSGGRSNIIGVGLQERRLRPTVLNTYRTTLDIDDIRGTTASRGWAQGGRGTAAADRGRTGVSSSRAGRHLEFPTMRIMRGTALDQLLAAGQPGPGRYRKVPVQITDRTLSDEANGCASGRPIHRQRKEWDARDWTMVAPGSSISSDGTSACEYSGPTPSAMLGQPTSIVYGNWPFAAVSGEGSRCGNHLGGGELMGLGEQLLTSDGRRRSPCARSWIQAHSPTGQGPAQAPSPARSRRARTS